LGLELFLAGFFEKIPLSPNAYTFLSLVSALAGLAAMIGQKFLAALFLIALAALLDLVDGAVARSRGISSKKGAYLDTIADRYVEAITISGFFFVNLPDVILPAGIWIFLVLLGSTMTTYVKAAAKEKGLSQIELKGGLMSRAERLLAVFAILVAVIFGYYLLAAYILAALALLANLTALQRIVKALK